MDGNEAKEAMARELRRQGKGVRHISKALGMGRKKLRRILGLSEVSSPGGKKKSSKLDRFKDRVRQLAELKEGPAGAERMLTVKGIFRTLRKEGYGGGMTILGDMVREIRGASRAQAAFARYEPAPGLEAQSDWSPYRVLLGGREAKVHVFSMILSYSRYQYLEAFADEGQDALFQGHVEGFKYFRGIPAKILYDNQSPVAACRIGGKALLNPRFEAFARHYGFRPVVGEPYRKERRGRVERPFGYIESDFLPGRRFSCLEDFRTQLRGWLEGKEDGTGNYRVHGTTRRRPVDMWAEERGLLIELPPSDFLPVRIEERIVNKDCTVSVSGNLYTVPPRHAGRKVTVMTTPKEVKVFDQRRELVASHKAAEGKGRMVIDEAHYEEIRRARRHVALPALEQSFLALFPSRGGFVDGLKARVKSIYPIHLKHLHALREHFTRMQVDEAMAEAEKHGIFTSTYVEEILNRRHPSQVGFRSFEEDMEKPKGFSIGELDPGDPGHYNGIFNDKGKEDVDGR